MNIDVHNSLILCHHMMRRQSEVQTTTINTALINKIRKLIKLHDSYRAVARQTR